MSSFADYYQILRYGPRAEAEIQNICDLVTNSETYFFREIFQLEAFRDETIPKLVRDGRNRRHISCWSMGCSTGEEAYSIAAMLDESGLFANATVRVIGTDLSHKRIATARRGVYAESSFRATTPIRRKKYFQPSDTGSVVCSQLRAMCRFEQANMLDIADQKLYGQADAIFCRNVLIYFAEDSRRRVLRMLFDRLLPGGFLMLGHSESLLADPAPFTPVRLKNDTVYQRPENPLAHKPSYTKPSYSQPLTNTAATNPTIGSGEKHDNRVKVIIVDDSPLNRRGIRRVLEDSGRVSVVGEASGGEEALRIIESAQPQAVTLDLEMPGMDGFTFLRILMSRHAVPVIVVSSHSRNEHVFKALELGAIDFVEKPHNGFYTQEAANQLVQKVLLARTLRPIRIKPYRSGVSTQLSQISAPTRISGPSAPLRTPRFVIAIAASTGGPTALLDVFSRLPASLPAAVLVSQHMPHNFTGAFASRLDRSSSFTVREASDGDQVYAHHAYVCPGGKCMELTGTSLQMKVRTCSPDHGDSYVPSADRLFRTVAQVAKSRSVGVVLTGMGDDGVEGARAIAAVRGLLVVESRETAVVDGMPMAVIRAGVACRVLPLPAIGELLADLGT